MKPDKMLRKTSDRASPIFVIQVGLCILWFMESVMIDLYKATDAEDSYSIRLAKSSADGLLAERGYGQKFEKVWSVELQSDEKPDLLAVDWESVLDRVIEAYSLSDPLIANFRWPMRSTV